MSGFKLRPYQRETVDAGLDALAAGDDSLLVLPTGAGKSPVAATLMRELCDEFGQMRILNVTHVAELVEQNYTSLVRQWDWAPAGVYSAGLGRKELGAQLLFAGIQSVHSKVEQLGHVDVMFVDEAHLIPRKGNGQYLTFIERLRDKNPDVRLCGLTATDFRLDSGKMTEGDDALFKTIAHEVKMRSLLDEGYLTPLSSKATATTLSTAGVGRRGGEFVASELQAAVDTGDLNRAIIEEVIEYGQGRRSWMVFAAGVEHAHHLAEELRIRGISVGVVTGATPLAERRNLIAAFKGYRMRALVSCGTLTTGFDHEGVDLIAAARPTESTGLYIQIAGRGTRNCYAPGFDMDLRAGRLASIAAGPKPNCLFLDYGGLVRRHGPVDNPVIRQPGSGKGDAPTKTCPKCAEIIHASAMECPTCGHEFERQLSEKITQTASALPILSKAEPVWSNISRRGLHRHSKYGSPDSVRVEYWQGFSVIAKQWVAVENPKAAGIVKSWWKTNGGQEPTPATVTEFMERAPKELRPIDQIRLEPDGKFFKVTGFKFRQGENEDEVACGPIRFDMRRELQDEDIAF